MNENTSRVNYKVLATQIRAHALRMTHRAKSSHIGGSLSIADLLAVLYGRVLHIDPAQPEWPDRDRRGVEDSGCCLCGSCQDLAAAGLSNMG